MANPEVDASDVKAVEEREAEFRVPPDETFLVFGKAGRLLQNGVRHGDLPEIVEQAGEPHARGRLFVEAELECDCRDQPSHRLRVNAGVRVLRVDDSDQVLGDAKARPPLGDPSEVRRREHLNRRGPVDARTVLAVVLRPVQRRVGDPLQLLEGASVLGKACDADAGPHWLAVWKSGLVHDAVEVLDELLSLLGIRVDDERELVPAESVRACAGCTRQDRRQLAEHLVAHLVAVDVVDSLEVIHVQQAQRERRTSVLYPLDRLAQLDLV